MNWQAEGSTLSVSLEPYPDQLPTNILADFKWLREDLMCVAANALKFSQERSKVPVIVRVTIDTNDNDTTIPMLRFSFMDSGQSLSENRYSTLFDHPKMLSSERMGMGGMGLGLYCLRERVTAMGGRYGARKRNDGLEGTEVWFSIPLLHADVHLDSFEIQYSYQHSPTSPVTEKEAPAIKESSTKKPNETKPVSPIGASRKSSTTSSHRNGVFVFHQSKPSNQSSNNSRAGTPRSVKVTPRSSNKSAFSALISSRKSTRPQQLIDSVRDVTAVSNVVSRRPSHDDGVSNTLMISNEIVPSLTATTERFSREHDDSSALISDEIVQLFPSMKCTTATERSDALMMVQPFPSMKSISASERIAIDSSPFVSRRSSLEDAVNDALLSNEIVHPMTATTERSTPLVHDVSDALVSNEIVPAQPLMNSMRASERNLVDSSPILSRRSSFDHFREESYKSIDTSLVASSLKPIVDQVNEDTGEGALPILIVDDSIAILKMIKRSILNELPDLVIKEARNGLEAFDRVQEEMNGFHVIITDIQMPCCDGFEFTRRVREFETKNCLLSTTIVGMSANCQAKFVMESQACGMDGFIHKPFELQTLLDVINHVHRHRDLTNRVDTLYTDASSLLHFQVIYYASITYCIFIYLFS